MQDEAYDKKSEKDGKQNSMEKCRIAAQVYSVRGEARADLKGTLQALKDYGYDGVELAGLYEHSPEEIRDMLQEIGLVPVSAHVGLDLFLQDRKGTVEAYRVIGCRYIGIPSLPDSRMPGGCQYQETIEEIKEISECCREAGITLLYHNHCFEFEKDGQGRYLLDVLFADAGDALQTEFDTCWVKAAGEDPVAYLEKYQGRCPVIHSKDCRPLEQEKVDGSRNEDKVELTALGDGCVNVIEIAKKALACGAEWIVVEQDTHSHGTPMENMKKSAAYLKEGLKK